MAFPTAADMGGGGGGLGSVVSSAAKGMALGGPVGAIAAGGLSLLGDVFGSRSSAKEAKRQREWQERMANTAHQREVADLRAAGLNPILSGTGGAGAPTPSGAQAQVPDYGGTIAKASGLALQREAVQAQIDNTNASTRKTEAEREGVVLDNKNKATAYGFTGAEKALNIQTMEQTLSNLTRQGQVTGQQLKDMQRDYDNMADVLTWAAAKAPAKFENDMVERTIKELRSGKADEGTAAAIWKMLPALKLLLKD